MEVNHVPWIVLGYIIILLVPWHHACMYIALQDNQWLAEGRRIRAEQDQALAESLEVDQAKVCGTCILLTV